MIFLLDDFIEAASLDVNNPSKEDLSLFIGSIKLFPLEEQVILVGDVINAIRQAMRPGAPQVNVFSEGPLKDWFDDRKEAIMDIETKRIIAVREEMASLST